MQKTQKIIITLLVLIALLLIISISLFMSKNRNILQISTSSSTQTNEISSKKVVLDASNPSMQDYSTLFNAEFAKNANYENFRIVSVPCKEDCITVYALNKDTGKIYLLAEKISGYNIHGDVIGIAWMSGIDGAMYYDQATDSFKAKPSDNHYGI